MIKMMKTIFILTIVLSLLLVGCQPKQEPATSGEEISIDEEIQEIESIDEDLGLEELDNIEDDLDAIDW